MLLNEILNDRRMPKLLEEFWHVEFSFDDKSFDEVHYYEKVTLGYNFEEYYIEGIPYSKYYKRYGNMLKHIPKKDKIVTKMLIGCSGRQFEATFYMDNEEYNTVDKFFEHMRILERC